MEDERDTSEKVKRIEQKKERQKKAAPQKESEEVRHEKEK